MGFYMAYKLAFAVGIRPGLGSPGTHTNTHESPCHYSVGPPRTGVNQYTPDSGESVAEIPPPHPWPVEHLRWCLASRSRVL